MNVYRFMLCSIVSALFIAFSAFPASAQTPTTQQISVASTTSIQPAPQGPDGVQSPEVDDSLDVDLGSDFSGGGMVNRSFVTGPGPSVTGKIGKKAKSNPQLNATFNGLNFRDQRLANNGNQFSVEPPDQGLCVGNGFVLESVNDVLRVYDSSGNALVGTTDLNTFYGYPAAINRATNARGPFVTDPSCFFDPDTQRWFQLVLTLDHVGTTPSFSGTNHLDLAVSTTSSPLGTWNIYRLPVQDDGTQGTPNHNCAGGPCLGDYPHIGADANGIYITTNEFNFFASGFHGSQIYAISKQALAASQSLITVIQFDTADPSVLLDGNPGFTVWPATSPAGQYATDLGGTEYFLSSVAVFSGAGSDSRLRIWALTNTQSLNSGNPVLSLRTKVVNTQTYSVPPKSGEKVGDFPLGQCLDDSTILTPFGTGCWRFFFVSGGPFSEVEAQTIDSQDSRMQQIVLANGKLWGALDTGVSFNGTTQAGIAYFIITPQISPTNLAGKIVLQGVFGLANNNLTYPAVGVTASGRGVIAFTVLGSDNFPSAGYASLDAQIGAGDIHVVAAGLGPDDGFTAYKAFVGNPPRIRWGDYGATALDGNSIWIASEYIGQTCDLTTYVATGFACNASRTSLGNWYTRISKLTP
jgi:hypothetical protein